MVPASYSVTKFAVRHMRVVQHRKLGSIGREQAGIGMINATSLIERREGPREACLRSTACAVGLALLLAAVVEGVRRNPGSTPRFSGLSTESPDTSKGGRFDDAATNHVFLKRPDPRVPAITPTNR